MKYNQGDIVLVPYPFTDLSSSKKRPVVIISKDSINDQDYVVAKISSVIKNDNLSILIKPADTKTSLHFLSEVRTNNLLTIHSSLIIKKITSFNKEPLTRITESIKDNLSVE